ncbi:Choline/ethanolaminephosphotransferase [Lentinula aciculospora]|uniref:diacylglycerol cholinephosphotransferase n=1 Tax=Lentinula aciculospora TaxID=153920 RepID=A0A9W9DNC4_9AGAR|nr:Choline/ethanolaminephosphotransferase [Lentinula aciculospora]
MKMSYLSDESLQNLKKYVYNGVDKSILSKHILNPFWAWFVTLWPLSIAPNTITLSGLSIVIFNFITLLYYDPSYLSEKGGVYTPRWIYLTWAIGLFLYQTFDAIDGKQARRTGMSGPLGQMFDHGCDALNTTLEAIIAAQALNLGRSWWTLASQVATLGNFYLTTWEEYHTGCLYLGVFSGPVEGILMIVAIYIITWIYGPSFWDTGILDFLHLSNISIISNTIPNIGLNVFFMLFGAGGLAFNIFSSYMNVRRAMRGSGKSTMKPLLLLLPFVFSAGIQVMWVGHPEFGMNNEKNNDYDEKNYYDNYNYNHDHNDHNHDHYNNNHNHKPEFTTILNSPLFIPFLCAWGFQFAHQVGRMILSHLTKSSSSFPFWDWLWVLSIVGAVDANLTWIVGIPPIIQSTPFFTALYIYTTLFVSFITYARFCVLVIKDVTEFMGVACFTVRKKDGEGRWRGGVGEGKGMEGKGKVD